MDIRFRIGAAVVVTFIVVFFTGCVASSTFSPETSAAEAEASEHRGLWVFTDEVSDPNASLALLDYAESESFTRLYVSVYSSRQNAQGQQLYEHDSLRRFIRAAHKRGIQIWAAYGDAEWPALGCGAAGFPCRRLSEVVAYNQANAGASFDGVMLDGEPEDNTNLLPTLQLYGDVLDLLEAHGLPVATAISAFWSSEITRSGLSKPAFQHVLDQGFDHVLVMCYRNFADGANGAIDLCADGMRYADQLPAGAKLVVGLRTTSVAIDGGSAHESFSGFGPHEIKEKVRSISSHFDDFNSYDGVAFHR